MTRRRRRLARGLREFRAATGLRTPASGLDAVHRGEFSLVFQPFVTTLDAKVERFEALLRWDHQVRGSIPPSEIVPIAEQAGLIAPIGARVLDQACREAVRWPPGVRVAVELSPLQLRDLDLSHIVATTLAASGLAPSRLELEITESRLTIDDEIARATMRRFRELKVWLVMDDFGAASRRSTCCSGSVSTRSRSTGPSWPAYRHRARRAPYSGLRSTWPAHCRLPPSWKGSKRSHSSTSRAVKGA